VTRRRRKRRTPAEGDTLVSVDDEDGAPVRVEIVEKHDPPTRGQKIYVLVRSYVLLFTGVGLVIYSLIGGIKPASLTLGGALIGLNPLLKVAAGGGHHE
jgi:hypothetical protein